MLIVIFFMKIKFDEFVRDLFFKLLVLLFLFVNDNVKGKDLITKLGELFIGNSVLLL